MAPAVKPLLLKEGAWLGSIASVVAFADYVGILLGLVAVTLTCFVSYFRLMIVLDERKRAKEEAGEE